MNKEETTQDSQESAKQTPLETKERFSLVKYVKNSYKELKKVKWPTRKDAIRSTGIVIIFSVLVAGFLGVLDYGFNQGLTYLISLT
ncbi:MAG: preprotein translocase subunit SecE [bacterium]|nr:preprotein translocase subunit SecE [bacterium]